MLKKVNSILFYCCLCLIASCSDDYTPKPRIYPKINYPTNRDFVLSNPKDCPFTFYIPQYAHIEKEKYYFDEKPPHPCWFNIQYPIFQATLHCSYYTINGLHDFEKLHEDAFRMSNHHQIRADYIEPIPFHNPKNNTSGYIFSIEGAVASPFQFYLSDSTKHFLKGSLYFNAHINIDSLLPIQEFVKADVLKTLNSFSWQ
ncbi:MAG: hypothetical protein IPO14_01470 [Saprospiraceae bacterium]|nr:hypothetical protein [Saprospiraceae bacterium]